jgi:hypothetical protein
MFMLGGYVQIGPPRFLFPSGWTAKVLCIFLVFIWAKCLSCFTHRHLIFVIVKWHVVIDHNCVGVQGVGLIRSFTEQPDTETSTWHHTAFTRDRHRCPGGIRTYNPSKPEAADLHLRPRRHGNRLERNLFMVYLTTLLILWLVWRRVWGMIVNTVWKRKIHKRKLSWPNVLLLRRITVGLSRNRRFFPAEIWMLVLRNVVETAQQFRFDFSSLAMILECKVAVLGS